MSAELVAENFLRDPAALRAELTQAGALEFNPHPSGLFVASYMVGSALANAIDMSLEAWWRDQTIVGLGLLERGTDDDITKIRVLGRHFLDFLHRNETRIDDAIRDPEAPPLPVRIDAVTLANDIEPRDQTDSTACTVFFPGKLALDKRKILRLTRNDLGIMSKVARYLGAREFWQRPEQGCWEEDTQLHASSIGAAVAGLGVVQNVFHTEDYHSSIDFNALIGQGDEAYKRMLPWETRPSSTYRGRPYDASHLLLSEIYGLRNPKIALAIRRIEQKLVREHGVIRNIRDTYFAPGFTEMLQGAARTTMSEESLELRDTLADVTEQTHSEAQWTLFAPLLSARRGRHFKKRHSQPDRDSQLRFLNMYLAGHVQTADGRLLVPELRYKETVETQEWIPNDHMPLLMAQATGLLSLLQFERIAA